MARILFLYVSTANGSVQDPFDHRKPCQNRLVKTFLQTDGFVYLWSKIIDVRAVFACLTVIESKQGPGRFMFGQENGCLVMPHLDYLKPFLQEGDIILARGGFHPWKPFLEQMNRGKRWVLFYRAGTGGRMEWPYWDLVLNDLACEKVEDRFGRFVLPFYKPVNESVFFYDEKVEKEYDLIIGANSLYDRKGQWKAIDALVTYKKIFGKNLRACLPGPWRKEARTNQIRETIQREGLNVEVPGFVPRNQLASLFNKSKLFVHLSAYGQNDRCVLEAMACGLPVMLQSSKCHSPFLTSNPEFSLVSSNSFSAETVAKEMHGFLERSNNGVYKRTESYYLTHNGVEQVIVPFMKNLVSFCDGNKPDRSLFKEFAWPMTA